jgi:zinc D-Ala-D-Ala carboxypeptidase
VNLTKNFTLGDLTQSAYAARHALDNTPSAALVVELRITAQMLQRIRDFPDIAPRRRYADDGH